MALRESSSVGRLDIYIYLNFAYEKKEFLKNVLLWLSTFRLLNDYMDGYTKTSKNILIFSCYEC